MSTLAAEKIILNKLGIQEETSRGNQKFVPGVDKAGEIVTRPKNGYSFYIAKVQKKLGGGKGPKDPVKGKDFEYLVRVDYNGKPLGSRKTEDLAGFISSTITKNGKL